MTPNDRAIASHYGIGGLLRSILDGLAANGVDCNALQPADLAPVDAFHTRGREATLELAARAQLRPGLEVLDVGCGPGSSVRHVAAEHACNATGVDSPPGISRQPGNWLNTPACRSALHSRMAVPWHCRLQMRSMTWSGPNTPR